MLLGVNLMIDHAQWWPRDVKLFSLWTTLGWLSLDKKNCHVSPWGDTWQFSIRTFLRVSAFPYPEKLLLQIVVHCSSCTGEIFLLQQVLILFLCSTSPLPRNQMFSISKYFFPVHASNVILHSKIFLLSFLQSFSCFYSLWFFVPPSVTLLPICRRMKCNMNSPSLMVAAVPQKICCKIRGKCCKSGVKWAKVGPAGWKEPLSASALLPCQLLNPLPHTLFNFQLEATPKKSAEEFWNFLSLSHSICPSLRLARIEEKFWRHYFCIHVRLKNCFPQFWKVCVQFQEFEWWALVQSDFQDISHSFDEHARQRDLKDCRKWEKWDSFRTFPCLCLH